MDAETYLGTELAGDQITELIADSSLSAEERGALIDEILPVFEPTVSHRTHLFGFGVGMVLGLGYFHFNKVSLRRAERVEIELDD